MKKVVTSICILIICITVFSGCNPYPVKEDLINYINYQVPNLTDLEEKLNSEYSSIVDDSEATDALFAAQLENVILPLSDELIETAKLIVPKAKEVRKLHNKHLESIKMQREGLALMLEAARDSDESLSKSAYERIKKAETIWLEYYQDLIILKKKHNITDEFDEYKNLLPFSN